MYSMKIKRILAMLVAVFMVASVAACGPAANPMAYAIFSCVHPG